MWEIPAVTNQVEQFGHPAVCPVEIPFRTIQAYTGRQGSVFEPFGGSGPPLSRPRRLLEKHMCLNSIQRIAMSLLSGGRLLPEKKQFALIIQLIKGT